MKTTMTAALALVALCGLASSAEARWVCQQWHHRTCVRAVWVQPPPQAQTVYGPTTRSAPTSTYQACWVNGVRRTDIPESQCRAH